MSYCRMGNDSDLYVYQDVRGQIRCMWCSLTPKVKTIFTVGNERMNIPPCLECNGEGCEACMMYGTANFDSGKEAIEHIKKHIENGDKVPDYVIEEIQHDIDRHGDDVGSW